MNQSSWLTQHVAEVQGKRDKSSQSKKVIFIIVPLMMILMVVAGLMGAKSIDAQTRNGIFAMLGVFVGIMIFVFILVGKGKKIDATKGTRESVMALFKTDEDVKLFDTEMNRPPLKEIIFSGTEKFFVTEHYIGISFMMLGDLQFRFAEISEIGGLTCNMSGSLTRQYRDIFFDILNKDGQKIFGATAPNSKHLDEMATILKELVPQIAVKVI